MQDEFYRTPETEEHLPPDPKMKKYHRYINLGLTAMAAILLAVTAFLAFGRLSGRGGRGSATGSDLREESGHTAVPETESPEQLAAEKQAIVDSYGSIGIADVEGYLNIRQEPLSTSDIIGKLMSGSACTIVEDADTAEGWYKITSGGIEGYVKGDFVLTGDAAKEKALTLVENRAIVRADSVNIRKEPSLDAEVVGQALEGERYVVTGEVKDGWVPLKSGYISADYVEVKQALNEARKLDMRAMVLNLYDNMGISSVTNYLNVRQEPSEEGKIIGKMTSYSAGEILEKTDDGQWYKIQSGPVTGYVNAQYILTGPDAAQAAMDRATLMAIVSADVVNARLEPSTDSRIWTQITNSERYDVVSQQDGWVGIQLDDDQTAYVATDFVDVRYALPEAIKFSPVDVKDELRSRLVNYALQFVGNRYVWGGNDPHTGADCSGFVKYCYQNVCGITLERVSRAQAQHGTKVDPSQMKPGDLVFYTHRNGVVGHVAMYIGNGQIVHAASRRSGIKISSWNYHSPYVIRNYIGN